MDRLTRVKLGFLFSWGGIGAAYCLLTIAYLIQSRNAEHDWAIYVTCLLCLVWAIIQFSFLSFAHDPSNNRLILTRYVLGIPFVSAYPLSGIESYNLRSTTLSGSISGSHGKQTGYFSSRSWLMEIRLRGSTRSIKLFSCNKKQASLIRQHIIPELNLPSGKFVKHKKSFRK